MIISKKRGLSEVLNTVIIILLVVVALGVIWAVIRPLIGKADAEITYTAACTGVGLEVKSCAYSNIQGFNVINVFVQKPNTFADLRGIKLILSNGTIYELNLPAIPGDIPFQLPPLLAPPPPLSVDVAGVINVDGNLRTCQPSGQPVQCI